MTDDAARREATAAAPGTRSRPRGLVHALLRYAARGARPPPAGRPAADAGFDRADDSDIARAMDAGLAAILHRATREGAFRMPDAWREQVLAADLTAQVRHRALVETATEVIDLCHDLRVPVTLLKGISISEQLYARPHERPMGDIDVLVPAHERERVEAALVRRGYTPLAIPMDDASCHGPPLCQPDRHAWVEIHGALFPPQERLRANRLFSAAQIEADSVDSTFQGRPVRRLANELQLAYVAASWIRDLVRIKPHPTLVPPLFDAVHLLGARGPAIDWDRVLARLDNDMAMASLYVVLAYLAVTDVDDSAAAVMPHLASGQDIVGPAELRRIVGIVDDHLVGNVAPPRLLGDWHRTLLLRTLQTLLTPGWHATKNLWIPWNVVFPPLEPDRYRVGYHWERVVRPLGRHTTPGGFGET